VDDYVEVLGFGGIEVFVFEVGFVDDVFD